MHFSAKWNKVEQLLSSNKKWVCIRSSLYGSRLDAVVTPLHWKAEVSLKMAALNESNISV
jgi:hypothetical protein